jgi:hypothetical protein
VRLERRVGGVEHARLVGADGVDREQVAHDQQRQKLAFSSPDRRFLSAARSSAAGRPFEKENVKMSAFATPCAVSPW